MTSHENNYVESVSVNKGMQSCYTCTGIQVNFFDILENHENIYSEINSDSKTSSL